MIKICTHCELPKDIIEFRKRNLALEVLTSWCKECIRISGKESTKRYREKIKIDSLKMQKIKSDKKKASLKFKYNITLEDFNNKVLLQNSRCRICGTTEAGGKGDWHVDHDHKTNTVRGILCPDCNVGLGLFHDDIQSLSMAIQYLIKSKKETIAA